MVHNDQQELIVGGCPRICAILVIPSREGNKKYLKPPTSYLNGIQWGAMLRFTRDNKPSNRLQSCLLSGSTVLGEYSYENRPVS